MWIADLCKQFFFCYLGLLPTKGENEHFAAVFNARDRVQNLLFWFYSGNGLNKSAHRVVIEAFKWQHVVSTAVIFSVSPLDMKMKKWNENEKCLFSNTHIYKYINMQPQLWGKVEHFFGPNIEVHGSVNDQLLRYILKTK